MSNMSNLKEVYTTFGGADIVATFDGEVIGSLQAITYSITREKAPIYTMGSPDPRSFSRGKRGIAGSLVFTRFDSDALMDVLMSDNPSRQPEGLGQYGWSNGDSVQSIEDWNNDMNELLNDSGFVAEENLGAYEPNYIDEIPPFDITITFANEYGQVSHMVIYGVEILNEGSGMSVDDVVTERALTFVARKIKRMTRGKNTGKKNKTKSNTANADTSTQDTSE